MEVMAEQGQIEAMLVYIWPAFILLKLPYPPSKREDTKKTAISLTYVALRNIVVDNINHLNVNSV